jgi:hypothetical protein
MKTCSKCKIEKSKSEFNKDKSKKDGLLIYCKICHREKKNQWCIENPDKVRESAKTSYYNNHEYNITKNAKYRKENKEYF